MSTLKEILKEYNQEDNENRWELWKNHREAVVKLQEKNIFSVRDDIDTAIVLGAGNCDDIDLNYLCSKVSKLTLVDMDLEIMKSGVEKQNLSQENYEKIEFVGNVDFTGLEDTKFYEELEELLERSKKPKQVLKLITKSLKLIEENTLLKNQTYSLVISGAIHSELTAASLVLLNKYSKNYSNKDFKKIHKDLIYLDDTISINYNDLIMSLAKEDGVVFSWFDLKEFSKELDNYDEIDKVDKYCKEGNSEKVIELVTENKFVGFHGYLDLNKRALEKNLKTPPWVNFWIWKYSINKSYLVFSITIDLSNE